MTGRHRVAIKPFKASLSRRGHVIFTSHDPTALFDPLISLMPDLTWPYCDIKHFDLVLMEFDVSLMSFAS